MDHVARVVEPVLCALAVLLVGLDAWVFFSATLPRLRQHQGPVPAAAHAAFGLWLLFNVLLNHGLCTFTSPGTTKHADPEELGVAAMSGEPGWRWCDLCSRHKPPMAHHCSVCGRCALKMDHHCVWMCNCIGFNNYRFFFLYIFWMWVGCMYSVGTTYVAARGHYSSVKRWMDAEFLSFFMMIMAFSAWLGLSVLLGWHTWVVLCGSGTIDAMMGKGWADRHTHSSSPYDLGAGANWREAFDVGGSRPWWLTWMLPSLSAKRGHGYRLPTNKTDWGKGAAIAV
ncbi:hypothetical protein FOA52_000103 [Chlamydomonas sp. UWO 241]|nr:hypothetical protein FOA52_000103 [Chlamydomonas sp. UWO 241]